MTSQSTHRRSRDEGAVAIIVAVFVVLAMILLAFVIDRGRVYVTQAQLQNAVDAAALAGAQEMCVGSGGDPTAVAIAYAGNNDVSISNSDVVVQTGVPAFVNVRANRVVDLVFGSFVGTQKVAVAAQATAMRTCSTNFRIVAKVTGTFTGTGTNGDNIYAGQCFSDGGNGNTFGLVAVASARTNPNSCGSQYYYPIWNEAYVSSPRYGVTINFSQIAIDKGIIAKIAAIKAANPSPPTCASIPTQANQPPWTTNADIYCTGNGAVTIPDVTYTGNIVAEGGKIDMKQNTLLAKKPAEAFQLIYTNAVAANPNTATIGYQGDIGADTVLYAPSGTVKEGGSNANMLGQILAQDVFFAGGGQNAGTGFDVPYGGPVSLVQ